MLFTIFVDIVILQESTVQPNQTQIKYDFNQYTTSIIINCNVNTEFITKKINRQNFSRIDFHKLFCLSIGKEKAIEELSIGYATITLQIKNGIH